MSGPSPALGLLVAVLSGVSAAQDLRNPFARPEAEAVAPSHVDAVEPQRPVDVELRATLVRGRDSSANIGGTIVRVGERVGSFRLVSVRERAAVIVDSAGVSYVLEMSPPRQVLP